MSTEKKPGGPTVESSSDPTKKSVTFPPDSWARDENVATSAAREGAAVSKKERASSVWDELDGERLTEARAREVVGKRFAAAGVELEADVVFTQGTFAINLDGYDAKRRVGYAYVSHGDADVLTDVDEATELALGEFAANGVAWLLLMHDTDVPNEEVLERRIDAFFQSLPR